MQPSFITNATQYKFCDMPIVKDREFCYHQPPMEMSLKLVGMCVTNLVCYDKSSSVTSSNMVCDILVTYQELISCLFLYIQRDLIQ